MYSSTLNGDYGLIYYQLYKKSFISSFIIETSFLITKFSAMLWKAEKIYFKYLYYHIKYIPAKNLLNQWPVLQDLKHTRITSCGSDYNSMYLTCFFQCLDKSHESFFTQTCVLEFFTCDLNFSSLIVQDVYNIIFI